MAHTKRPMIAIDGPAGSGKTTVAAEVAKRLGFTLLDTGALYRCVALLAGRYNVAQDDGKALGLLAQNMNVRFVFEAGVNRIFLNDEEVTESIRSPEIAQSASRVSALGEVRQALLSLQRELGSLGGIVAEGRDVGTVVFPAAEIKVFLKANPTIRAQRRHTELRAKGYTGSLEQTLDEVQKRDQRDRERKIAPLRPAEDATQIDTSDLAIEEVVGRILQMVRSVSD